MMTISDFNYSFAENFRAFANMEIAESRRGGREGNPREIRRGGLIFMRLSVCYERLEMGREMFKVRETRAKLKRRD